MSKCTDCSLWRYSWKEDGWRGGWKDLWWGGEGGRENNKDGGSQVASLLNVARLKRSR